MPRPYTLNPESFVGPNPFSPYMHISFRVPYESRTPIVSQVPTILAHKRQCDSLFGSTLTLHKATRTNSKNSQYPASNLQLSFVRPSNEQEIFLERITTGDIQHSVTGLCTVLVGKEDVPRYAVKEMPSDDEVLVRLHAWKGERHLGAWEVGKLSGEDAYKVVGQ